MTRRTRNYYVRRRQFSGGIGEAFRLAAIDFQLRAYSYAYSLFNYATKLKPTQSTLPLSRYEWLNTAYEISRMHAPATETAAPVPVERCFAHPSGSEHPAWRPTWR
jgi:hypothetical protein